MKTIFGSLLLSFLLLTGCGGEHGEDRAHDGSEVHSHSGGEVHEHDGAHAESGPATDAFYADDNGVEAAAAGSTDAAEPYEAEPDEAEHAQDHTHGDGGMHDHNE